MKKSQILKHLIKNIVLRKNNLDRRKNAGSLSRAGKKEGVWGRNFCLPVLSLIEFVRSLTSRRPPPFGRREGVCVGAPACVAPFQRTLAHWSSKNRWKLASSSFKISPNLIVEAAPFGTSRKSCCGRPRICKCANHFLAAYDYE